jgi:hypothetical protein
MNNKDKTAAREPRIETWRIDVILSSGERVTRGRRLPVRHAVELANSGPDRDRSDGIAATNRGIVHNSTHRGANSR